jgi:hypothetical protein
MIILIIIIITVIIIIITVIIIRRWITIITIIIITIITIIYIYGVYGVYIYTIDIPSLYTCYHIPCPSSHQAIGVTNYSLRHLKQLMKTCKIKRLGSAWATGRVGKIPDSERK